MQFFWKFELTRRHDRRSRNVLAGRRTAVECRSSWAKGKLLSLCSTLSLPSTAQRQLQPAPRRWLCVFVFDAVTLATGRCAVMHGRHAPGFIRAKVDHASVLPPSHHTPGLPTRAQGAPLGAAKGRLGGTTTAMVPERPALAGQSIACPGGTGARRLTKARGEFPEEDRFFVTHDDAADATTASFPTLPGSGSEPCSRPGTVEPSELSRSAFSFVIVFGRLAAMPAALRSSSGERPRGHCRARALQLQSVALQLQSQRHQA